MAMRTDQMQSRKRRIEQRLEKSSRADRGRPMLSGAGITYELSQRSRGMCYGGIGAMLQFVQRIGLVDEIDRRLHLLRIHNPYHESDHVLNLALSIP